MMGHSPDDGILPGKTLAGSLGLTPRHAPDDPGADAPLTLSIAAVERDCGLSKDTLRIWERRYGFPRPLRDTLGERAYPVDQVQRLRVLRRLLDAGHRPGKVVPLSADDLVQMASSLRSEEQGSLLADPRSADIEACLVLVKRHDVQALRHTLAQLSTRMGLATFVNALIAPLNRVVGNAWLAGELEVFQEHMYTESVQIVLRNQINHIPPATPQDRPRVLLSTFPGEGHGLGLLMAEALLTLEGCYCVSLGTQTPLSDIVLAAHAHRSDIVALSFTAVLNPNHVLAGLSELRLKLPPQVPVWAGGSAPVLGRRRPDGIVRIDSVRGIPAEVQRWRDGLAASSAAAPFDSAPLSRRDD